MKKILLTGMLLLSFACIAIASDQTYSQGYINNLKSCTPYSEIFTADINTQDPNTPVIYLESKESIIGIQNEKCLTNSTVYNITTQPNGTQSKEKILTVDCKFTQEQINSISSKMQELKTNPNIQGTLQEEMAQYVKNPDVCTIINHKQSQN